MNFFNYENIKELINGIAGNIGFKSFWDLLLAIIDISIVSYVIYKLILLVRETRAWQLIKGILFILVAAKVSDYLGLSSIAFILNHTVSYIAITLVVLFQPELRRGLEQIGRSRFRSLFSFDEEQNKIKTTTVIEEIIKSVTELSKNYVGALIVFERETKIGEIIDSGTKLDSNVVSELLVNIFCPNTPLHDGAVIIRNNRIKAVSCFLPLTENSDLSKDLGTRHRAALGISEVSDSIAVIVSEETGKISFALNGGLTRNLTTDTLRKALNKNLFDEKGATKKIGLWKVVTK